MRGLIARTGERIGWAGAALSALILVRAGIQLHLYLGFDAVPVPIGDAAERVLLAWRWAQEPSFSVQEVWLPLPFWITGLGLILFDDPILMPVLVESALGLLSIWLVHRVTTLLSPDDPWAPFMAAAAAAFYPAHVRASMSPSSDASFWCAILAGCCFLLSWMDKAGARRHAFAALFFGLSAWIRYEGWLFCAIFFLLSLRMKKWRTGSLILAFPAVWMLHQLWTQGNPFHFLLPSSGASADHPVGFPNWTNLRIFYQLLLEQSPWVGLIAVLSLDHRRPAARKTYCLFALVPLSVHVLLSVLANVPAIEYHLVVFYLLLCPLWCAALSQLTLKWRRWSRLLLFSGLAAFMFLNAGKTLSQDQRRYDDRSAHLPLFLRSWTRAYFLPRESILTELPDGLEQDELRWRFPLPNAWRLGALPHHIHFDAVQAYRRDSRGRLYLDKTDNPSLLDLPADELQAWLDRKSVRLVVAQNPRGIRSMAFWAPAVHCGPYRLFARPDDALRGAMRISCDPSAVPPRQDTTREENR